MDLFSRIVGTGRFLPGVAVTNAQLAQRLAAQGIETSDEWIASRTGIRQRHIADAALNCSDLAVEASGQALQAAGLSAHDIDLIIVATSTPDMIFPSTACLVQKKLGIRNGSPAFDVQAVCTGFAYALATADLYLKAGKAKHALVIGSEVFSRILDWTDRTTCVLFGDGAGAVVLRADTQPGILAHRLHARGELEGILNVPGTVCGGKAVGHPFLTMDGQAVFKMAVQVLDSVAREVAADAGCEISDIDWLIPHQANVRILSATAKRLGLDESKVVITVDQHANTSAASVPMALDLAVRDGRIRPGHRVMMQGVGGGFTWGAVLADI
jgi:3-oxoacyl-[acyl-carrier-protein] synthase III